MHEFSRVPIVARQPDDKWRVIPGFPDYEMNLLEEVRKVAKLRKPFQPVQDGRHIHLWQNGKMVTKPALTLARLTWPEFYH